MIDCPIAHQVFILPAFITKIDDKAVRFKDIQYLSYGEQVIK